MSAPLRRVAVLAGGIALTWAGILVGLQHGPQAAATIHGDLVAPLAPSGPADPTATTGSSYAPTNPVDCTDPNNAINCQSPPVDSPLVVGTAPPGSPFRD